MKIILVGQYGIIGSFLNDEFKNGLKILVVDLNMECIYCKSKMKKGKTALTFQIDEDRIIVVKDVPASICEECGEESIDIKNTKIVETIVHKALADGIRMGFIEYNYVA